MHYTTEILDRTTGELKEVSLGHWITVTELGEQYGVGSKKVRSILHHMGLLQSEGQHGHYRLTPCAVKQGLGKRIEKSKRSKWPFDVISPEGQKLIAENWQTIVAEIETERAETPALKVAGEGLARFKHGRVSEPTTQMETCWLLDHFPDLPLEGIANLIGVQRPLVSRYANLRSKQHAFAKRLRNRTDAASSLEDAEQPGSGRSERYAGDRAWDSRRVSKEELLYSLSLYGFGSNPKGTPLHHQ